MVNVETKFKRVYGSGRIVSEDQYHQPKNINCGCSKTTREGAYRDVVVHYNGSRYYFYHQTAVVIELVDGRIFINNGGYDTKSTRARINEHTPDKVTMDKRDKQWYLQVGDEEREFNLNATVILSEDQEVTKE